MPRPDTIPHPDYRSWMHERCTLPTVSWKTKLEWWRQQPSNVQAIEAVVSRIFAGLGASRGSARWVTYTFIIRIFRLYFRAFNNLKYWGTENIPKTGCIFYANHPGSYDPPIMFSTIPNLQVGGFVAWGVSWFADMIDRYYNLSPFRRGNVQLVVEDVVRRILTKNRYFAIWPEGHPHPGPIEEGFSSIVRVYATINHDRDRIPFLPVLIRGDGTLRYGVKHKMGPIEVHFFKPIFIDRSWLKPPSEGGKTPREIIGHLMMFLARKNGQKEPAPNPRLEGHRRWHVTGARVDEAVKNIRCNEELDLSSCTTCSKIPIRFNKGKDKQNVVKGIPEVMNRMTEFMDDPTGIHRLISCPSCNAWYSIATREGKTYINRLFTAERVKHVIIHVIWDHQGKILQA